MEHLKSIVNCFSERFTNLSLCKQYGKVTIYSPVLLKLKLQYFGPLIWRANWLEKTVLLEKLRAGREGDDRGWDGWMASPAQWTWIWVNSRSWWWTGRSGVLWFMGLQRVGDNSVTELNWTDHVNITLKKKVYSHKMIM